MLEAWSRTRDGTRKLSANFTVAEFACKDWLGPCVRGTAALPPCCRRFRDHFGAP